MKRCLWDASKSGSVVIPEDRIRNAIFLIRNQKVMLDRDLATLYGVETKALKQAVKRNYKRFPEDFMFVLDRQEFGKWRSQNVTSISDRMGLRHAPMAFTEQGVAMLSGLLKSDRAIAVNIAIMRTFVEFRRMLETSDALGRKIAELEKKFGQQFQTVFTVLNELMTPPDSPRKSIGFHP